MEISAKKANFTGKLSKKNNSKSIPLSSSAAYL
jgi:hypothetical protein